MQIKWYLWVVVIVGFIISLYCVEVGPWGATQVGKYNEGYGTFDMKKYSVEDVRRVLAKMQPGGFIQSYRYYICDSIFLLFFGALQIMISMALYHRGISSGIVVILGILAIAVPIFRGVFDMIENGLLCYTLKTYPNMNETIVRISSFVTQCKLMCIRIWSLLVIVGIVIRFFKRK